MKRLWRDFRAYKRAAVLFLVYWLATLAVVPMTWAGGIPVRTVVLLLTTPLIAGILVGRWRASSAERATRSRDRITGGMLLGVVGVEMTLLVMKGGIVDEVLGWTHGQRFQGGEVLEFCLAGGILGALLGLAGAVLSMVLDRMCRQGKPD
jgi:hypothetical protein